MGDIAAPGSVGGSGMLNGLGAPIPPVSDMPMLRLGNDREGRDRVEGDVRPDGGGIMGFTIGLNGKSPGLVSGNSTPNAKTHRSKAAFIAILLYKRSTCDSR